MSTLLLRLAAPMQSWGISSKFDRRTTNMEPTRSGVIGMLAAAMGVSREDSLDAFKVLKFGVRIDQPGTMKQDFHMVHRENGSKSTAWVTYRYYLEDAVFLAGLEGPSEFLAKLESALMHPVYPLALGRRSCPPAEPLVLGIRDVDLLTALRQEEWQASSWYQRKAKWQHITSLEIVRDAGLNENGYAVRDFPESFSQKRRLYHFRNVIREQIALSQLVDSENTEKKQEVPTEHDPMELLEDSDVSIKNQNQ